jgi:hypothetical protein
MSSATTEDEVGKYIIGFPRFGLSRQHAGEARRRNLVSIGVSQVVGSSYSSELVKMLSCSCGIGFTAPLAFAEFNSNLMNLLRTSSLKDL